MLSTFVLLVLFLLSRLVFCFFTLNNCGVRTHRHRYCNLEHVHRAHVVHHGAISSHSYSCNDHTARTKVRWSSICCFSLQVLGASIFLSFVFFCLHPIFPCEWRMWRRSKPVCNADIRPYKDKEARRAQICIYIAIWTKTDRVNRHALSYEIIHHPDQSSVSTLPV